MDAALLARFALLEDIPQDQVEILNPIMVDIQINANQTVFNQGEQADYLYFVISGSVSIQFKPDDGPVLTVADVREGGVFGWSSALGSACYTSSAICTEGGIFVRIAGEDLKKICQEHPETGILILNKLAGVIAQRLRGTHEQVVALLHRGLHQDQPGGCS
jgi:CRP-like cAMP-binding protein